MAQSRPAVYARVSSMGQTIASQLAEIRDYCEAEGFGTIPEADVYIDQDVSARKTKFADRPQGGLVYQKCLDGQYSHLILTRIDRACRDLRDLTVLCESLQNSGVALVFTAQRFNTATAEGKLMMHILGAYAQFETELIRERTKEALAYRKKRGQKLGGKFKDFADEKMLSAIRALRDGESIKSSAKLADMPRTTFKLRVEQLEEEGLNLSEHQSDAEIQKLFQGLRSKYHERPSNS